MGGSITARGTRLRLFDKQPTVLYNDPKYGYFVYMDAAARE